MNFNTHPLAIANYRENSAKRTGTTFKRMCSRCKTPKFMEGGTNINRKFVCKECK